MTAPDVNADVRARLLPCPFCGGMARLCIGYHAKYDVKVACDDCSSEGVLYGEDDFKGDHAEEWKRSAITAWNRRAAHADLSGQVRELVEALKLAKRAYWLARNSAAGLTNYCEESASSRRCERELSDAESLWHSAGIEAALAKFHPTQQEKP